MLPLRISWLRWERCVALLMSLYGVHFSVAARADSPPIAAELDWQGQAGWPLAAKRGPALAVVGKDDNIVLGTSKDDRASWVQRVRFHRTVVWQHDLPAESLSEAAILVDKDSVFVVHYCVMSSGATVHALELGTGKLRWTTPVQGLGPVAHSKYSNHVALKLVRGYLVAFGNEAQGRYIEVFDPQTGKMLSTHKLTAAKPG